MAASEDAPVIRLVNAVLVDAIKRGTSDITSSRTRRSSASASGSTACSKR